MAEAVARDCDLLIRQLTTLDELSACVDVQRAVWGWADLDLMPVRLFVLLQHVGGVVLGAYSERELVGFVNCVPGLTGGRAFWHSHMMGVLPQFQNRGIGTALKLAQKAHALRQGITSIQWVFDPLEAKNAHVNIAKLGAVVRRYSINHYGASTSRLHTGLESDRLVAEWRLDVPRVVRGGREARSAFVPDDVQTLRRMDPPAAKRLQLLVREQFQRNFSEGFVVVACDRQPRGCEYIFERDDSGAGLWPFGDADEDPRRSGGQS